MDDILYLILKIILSASFKKQETVTDNLPVKKYVSKIEDRITLEIKLTNHLKLLTLETMELFQKAKKYIHEKDSKSVPHLEITEVALVLCNVVNNNYQLDSRVLYAFDQLFDQLLEISATFLFLKAFNSEFPYNEVWFIDRNSETQEIEDKIKLTLAINWCIIYIYIYIYI